jgi:hypothetical protein
MSGLGTQILKRGLVTHLDSALAELEEALERVEELEASLLLLLLLADIDGSAEALGMLWVSEPVNVRKDVAISIVVGGYR